jgi:trehalose/maltose hydrolase-like predicted phosphorylase
MLEYRIRRLPAARAAARALGRAGARFPWESAASGADVTPAQAYDRDGRMIAIRTGENEEHIVADVAWGVSCYADWTGDEEFLAGPGGELLVETARYWASRVRLDRDGRAHIDGVIGPDEYHEPIDDNAYTNVMARWNLRRAARLGPAAGAGDEERERWLRVADALVDGYDGQSGLYEQFAGFWRLEPLVIADLVPRRPVSAEHLLGRTRVEGAQVLKQADVLMLHHLVPEEVEPSSLVPNLRFYEPRTAHGSSLSPGVHAALFARAGQLDEALAGLRLASRIDLDDLTGTTAGGLHLAAMGSVWQALAFGFAGLRPVDEALALDPRLPESWGALEVRVRFRGSRVRVRIEPRALVLSAEPEVEVALARGPDVLFVPPSGLRLERRNEHWEVQS